jgi:hypothetical protein
MITLIPARPRTAKPSKPYPDDSEDYRRTRTV